MSPLHPTPKKLFFLFLIVLTGIRAHAATCTAVSNTNWGQNATWSCGHVPTCGDSVVIPAGITVTIATQQDYSACASPIKIAIYGTLQFTTGNKLTLPCNSAVYVMPGGSVYPGNGGGNSNLIEICSVILWNAAYGPITSPVIITCCSPLPVELLYFRSNCAEGIVTLEWSTASELNNDYFTLERSSDGLQFEPVSTVDGAGTSSAPHYYSVKMQEELPGVYYYRLQQTDFNGTTSASQLTVTNCSEASPSLVIYPNPSFENFTLEGAPAGSTVAITNPEGQCFGEIRTVDFKTEIDAGNFAQGIYFVEVRFEGIVIARMKLVKN